MLRQQVYNTVSLSFYQRVSRSYDNLNGHILPEC